VAETARHARWRERVDRICASGADGPSLRIQLLDEIRGAVSFGAHAWLMTDPRTAVGSAPLADVPCLHELPRAIRLKYLTTVNRWTELAKTDRPVGLLRRDTADEPSRSLMWRDLQKEYAVVDVASVVFADRFGCWGFLDLWRLDAATAFHDGDAARLASVASSITHGLRTSQSLTFATPPPSAREGLGPMVLLLGNDLQVRSQTDATEEWLEVLLPAAAGAQPVPAAAYNVAAQLLAVEHDVDDNPPSARVHLAGGLWVTLRAARLDADSIAVTIEETTASDRLELFCACFGLSAREAELIGHLATGGNTRELAARMYVSEHTIQDHLKSIFAKTSSHNRRGLLSRALGTS
jgi:DNA-binding CsgD family transcriptional regulator